MLVKSHVAITCFAYFSLSSKLWLIIENVSFFKAASSVNSLNGDSGKKRSIVDCEESPNKKVKIEGDNKVSSVYAENNQQR